MTPQPHGRARPPLRLGVLDQVMVREGEDGRAALQESLELAPWVERLGYDRFWVAEHHDSPAFACGSPQLLLPLIAARTSSIRVGSGGVLLSLHSPLHTAETFRMLEAMYPSRIDLGIGRAPGTDRPHVAALLADGADGRAYGDRVAALLQHLASRRHEADPDAARVMPQARLPQVWTLGSGIESARAAAKLGTAFCFAQFFNPTGAAAALTRYRSEFVPSAWLAQPRAALAVMAMCAPTQESAERHASSRHVWYARDRTGVVAGLPSYRDAVEFAVDERTRPLVEASMRSTLAGTPNRVASDLRALADCHEVNELVIVTVAPDFAARKESYRLLAEACGLTPPAPGDHDRAAWVEPTPIAPGSLTLEVEPLRPVGPIRASRGASNVA